MKSTVRGGPAYCYTGAEREVVTNDNHAGTLSTEKTTEASFMPVSFNGMGVQLSDCNRQG